MCSVKYKNLKKILITGNITEGPIFNIAQNINNPKHTKREKEKEIKHVNTCSTLSMYAQHLSSVRDIEQWEPWFNKLCFKLTSNRRHQKQMCSLSNTATEFWVYPFCIRGTETHTI